MRHRRIWAVLMTLFMICSLLPVQRAGAATVYNEWENPSRAYCEQYGHSWTDWDPTSEPTCTEPGRHYWSTGKIVDPPTCTEPGWSVQYCMRCDDGEGLW